MDPARWQKLQDLFDASLALPNVAERERFLRERALVDAELVEQVRPLLAAAARPGIMDALAPQLLSVADALQRAHPERIGAYRVVRELGRGGMGVVYLAERADGQFQRSVAIKLIGTSNAHDPLHQRFLAERQILAGLIHPNIARLLDGGLTEDQRPYLVMEYVDGLPITTYCDQHRLDLRARLQLFTEVCAAVQHAHQNLVIHRDLKPSNILISREGRVQLLDFGIAKLINPGPGTAATPMTRVEWRMMTPEFASPEQVRGESLTTASDIYSLGVLLYELVCGHPPYQLSDSTPAKIAKAVCEQDPERPSVRARRADRTEDGGEAETAAQLRSTAQEKLARMLEGDLDGIVALAMRKEPEHRYASADMLRQDVERHLSGLPVLAHRGSRRYRIGKFLRLYRIEAAAAIVVLVTLLAGLSVTLAQSRRAGRERDRAERALAESSGVTSFLLDLFQAGEPSNVPAAQLSAADLLQRGALRASQLSHQPAVQARLLDVVGQMSLNLGRLTEAQQRLEQAVAIQRNVAGDTSMQLATSLIHLAWVHRTRNEFEQARKLVGEALDIRQRMLPAHHPDIAEAFFELGWLAFGPQQEQLYRQALSILSETDATAERRVQLWQALSTNLRRQGRLADAVQADGTALRIAQQAFGTEHHTTGYAMIHLADHVTDIEQDHARAEQLYRQGLALLTQEFGDNSTRLLHGLNSLAKLLSHREDSEAEQLYRRALAIRVSATGPEHLQVADQLQQLAYELVRQQRNAEAEALARQALDVTIRAVGTRHPAVTNARMPLLADVYDRQRRYQEADQMFNAALEQNVLQGVEPGQMRRIYGQMLMRRGDHTRAEQQLLRSLELLEKAYLGSAHPNVQETRRALMELYRQWGKPDLVERYRVPPGRYIPY